MSLYAQKDSLQIEYHRNSIYQVLLEHPGLQFGNEIKTEFLNIPLSDKYDNHNLAIRTFLTSEQKEQRENINSFFKKGAVARRLVAKWFNRDKETGAFNIDLVMNRGFYDATIMDYEIARQTVRGKTLLADAGKELLANTFVLINDIKYIDKEKRATKVGLFLQLGASVAGVVGGVSSGTTQQTSNSISSLANSGKEISDLIAGFTVIVTSYLYHLKWDEEISTTFYEKYYFTSQEIDNEKKIAFDNDVNTFSLEYIGQYSARSGETVLRGLHSPEEVIRKVCARTLDENIVQLQRRFETFKVKAPILSVTEKTLTAQIGMKEGLTNSSVFEVLEIQIDKDGKTKYVRMGVVKPIKGKIWDNRFMAIEEQAEGALLSCSEFSIVSGQGKLYPGMLLREIKF